MAKKKESTSLIEALSEFKELKNIDKNTMIQVLEDSFRNVLSKMFGSDDTFSVIINLEKKGDFEIWRTRRVVADEEVTDTVRQVALSEAQSIDPDVALGEDFVDAVDFTFGGAGKFPITDFCAAISVGIGPEGPITDLCYEEDSAAIVDMNVVRTGSGNMVEVQGTGEHGTFNRDELNALLDLAEAATDELMAKQREVLGSTADKVGKVYPTAPEV